MNDAVKKFVKIVNKHSSDMFINFNYELIVLPKNNIYVQLCDVENWMDVKCKAISWLSRPAHKGLKTKEQTIIRNIFNEILEKDFTKEEIGDIYVKYGLSYDYKKIAEFINSDYDLRLI